MMAAWNQTPGYSRLIKPIPVGLNFFFHMGGLYPRAGFIHILYLVSYALSPPGGLAAGTNQSGASRLD